MQERFEDPSNSRQYDQDRGSPGHPYESHALVRVDPDVVAVFVECADDVVDDCRGNGGRDHRSHESDETEQSVGQSDQFCASEETCDGTEKGDTCGGGCHAVQDKHDFAGNLDCVYAIFDR